MMDYRRVCIILLVLAGCSAAPVLGVTQYLSEGPKISASIFGLNEFIPGQDAIISLVIQNSGMNTFEYANRGTIAWDDLPNTAKLVTIGLGAGNAPVIIKTDPQMVGDIRSSGAVTVRFSAKILNNATLGEYELPLIIRYRYLSSQNQEAGDYLQSKFNAVNETVPITIKIKPQVKIEVLDAVPENLNVGTEGYLNLTIKNIGFEDGKKATVKISRNGASPVIPIDSSVFIGDFPRNRIVSCRYKVAVSTNAERQTYPIDVIVLYENRDGEGISSAPETIGVPIGGKIGFAVTSEPVRITPGSKNVIIVEYQNSGETTAYNAQAHLSVVDPFISSDNTAYLGDLKPGDRATARYDVSVSNPADIKEYTFDTEIWYRDALDNSQISDTVRVRVIVMPKTASEALIESLPVICLIIVVIIGAGYYLLVMRKKK